MLRITILASVIASIATRCLAQAPVSLPVALVGDTVTYAGRFATVACPTWTVTAVDRNGLDVSKCGGDTAYTRADDHDLVRITGPNAQDLVAFSPAAPSLEFPLVLNKTWSGRYSGFTAINGAHFSSVESCRVASWETIQVAAGTMPAYRIDCADHWTAGTASGQARQSSWFAPRARTVVMVRNAQQPQWDLDVVSFRLARP